MMLGIVSLLQVEAFLKRLYAPARVNFIMIGAIVASSYGIYLGRYLRFNSWDILTRPGRLARGVGHPVLNPIDNISVWAFVIFFSGMLLLCYYTIKQLQVKN